MDQSSCRAWRVCPGSCPCTGPRWAQALHGGHRAGAAGTWSHKPVTEPASVCGVHASPTSGKARTHSQVDKGLDGKSSVQDKAGRARGEDGARSPARTWRTAPREVARQPRGQSERGSGTRWGATVGTDGEGQGRQGRQRSERLVRGGSGPAGSEGRRDDPPP